MFITFEGPDGSGKSTAIKKICDYFDLKNINYLSTREPGNHFSKESKKIREIIVSINSKIPSITEALLFAADRRLHIDQVINPALKKGKIVLCDRYIDSSLAYQGIGRKIGIEKVKIINEIATDYKYPDLTIFFDIKPKESSKRVNNRKFKDRFELEGLSFDERVYNGYLKIWKMFPKRIIRIDASKSEEEVFEDIKKIILKKIDI